MRYPASDTAEKHARILDQAARLFRERGFSGVSLGEAMKAAGLTHGPFYNHFSSKQDLMAACIAHASAQSLADMTSVEPSVAGKSSYISRYLSPAHCNIRGSGCVIAALAAEIARDPSMKPSMTQHLRALIEKFASHFPWRAKRDARREAIQALSSMVGALVLARATDDEALSEEILEAVTAQLT
jgi:TetR/AcrR family transcriptional regulator, transcriptional repressor for nem operon